MKLASDLPAVKRSRFVAAAAKCPRTSRSRCVGVTAERLPERCARAFRGKISRAQDVHGNAKLRFDGALQADHVEQSRAAWYVDQQVNVAALGVFSARNGAEQSHVASAQALRRAQHGARRVATITDGRALMAWNPSGTGSLAGHTLERLGDNPRHWRIDAVKSVAARPRLCCRNEGCSHRVFACAGVDEVVCIPACRPIKPIPKLTCHGPTPEPVKPVQRLPRSLHAELVGRARSEGTSLNTLNARPLAEGVGRAAAATDASADASPVRAYPRGSTRSRRLIARSSAPSSGSAS